MEAEAKKREAQALRCSGQEALDHAIASAELYMKAAGTARVPTEKARLRQKCNDLLSLAERLKKIARAVDTVSQVEKRLKLPRLSRQIPISEQTILLRGSKLHGSKFPPWESDPDPEEFRGSSFIDASDFSLSDRQREVFAGWKRPWDIVGGGTNINDDKYARLRLMEAEDDFDLVQDITTDCSVVASLGAGIKHLRPGPTSILPTVMFPIDSEKGQPKVSENGKYVFRMNFNGCFRKVVIDDRLPSSHNERTLYVVDRQNPKLVWPALMEKAYLKVRGGYDFPGSNSGTDLWIITGWIPQQLFLQSDDIDFDQTWARVKKAYDYGDVIITLGTGRLSLAEEETSGLVGEHDYAVLDISESQGNKRMLVKNPWCAGLVWKGIGSSDARQSPSDHPTKLKPGSFWISFHDVTQNYESLYLNWNPGLFTERQDHHFVWELPPPSLSLSFAHNVQYSMTASASGSAWILLSRHFQDAELDIARALSNSTLSDVSTKLGFMSLYIFDNANGCRVELGDKSLYRGPFVDSPQTLAPFEAKKGVSYTIVVAQQGLPLPSYAFTLSFFSRCPLTITKARDSMLYHTELKSSWTRRTAGGNAAAATYLFNPQFALTIPKSARESDDGGPLAILLSTDSPDLAVHIDLVWASGRRVTTLAVRDIVATSGEYRRGCALLRVPRLDPGTTYTVVCSTFEPGQLADFSLRVGANIDQCRLVPVAADAAGMLRTPLAPLLFEGPSEAPRKTARVQVGRLTRASVILTRRCGGASGSSGGSGGRSIPGTPRSLPHVRLRVELGRGPDRVVVAASGDEDNDEGEFMEVGAVGLRTREFDLDPLLIQARRGLWIVVEVMGACPWLRPTRTRGSILRC
ncbi:Calpain-like protease palB/cpr-8 [Apiospora rasikravindrae]|uniref:Calpain-like protease palB/cpr-8 n=1 Tax=Apiospora rasikravindrae TaxID=990691 RepID=A0ABR1RWU0_9PEZI